MESPIVTVNEGQLQGGVSESYDGQKFYFFSGIPFGKAAEGPLRFQLPVPADPWSGIRDATKEGDKCIQRDLFTEEFLGSENCLHLNIYTRELPNTSTKLKPVMVWIHGGAFIHGSNSRNSYGPDYLLTEDIVLVSINYRVGIVGFLNVDPALGVPRNLGLKDQVLALKWVQNNIKAFNGDPNNVTIFGESAGGSAVLFHLISPKSKGLFHKAIAQSAYINTSWPENPSLIEILSFAGKKAKSEQEALDNLKSLPADVLFEAQDKYLEAKGRLIFSPGLESEGDDSFLTDLHLKAVLKNDYNKVPVVMGFNSNEGLLFEIEKRLKQAKGKKVVMEEPNIEKFLSTRLSSKVHPAALQSLHQKVKAVYFTGENAKNPFLLASDAAFNATIIMSAKLQAVVSDKPVYLYILDIDDDFNVFKKAGKCEDLPGMSHADELGYVFKNAIFPLIPKGSTAERTMRRLVTLWTNFAKYGNPTPEQKQLTVEWKPVTQSVVNFLEVNNTDVKMAVDPIPERYQLWQELFHLVSSSK